MDTCPLVPDPHYDDLDLYLADVHDGWGDPVPVAA